jgi:hypothetical protein
MGLRGFFDALTKIATQPDKDFGALVRQRRRKRGLPVIPADKVLPVLLAWSRGSAEIRVNGCHRRVKLYQDAARCMEIIQTISRWNARSTQSTVRQQQKAVRHMIPCVRPFDSLHSVRGSSTRSREQLACQHGCRDSCAQVGRQARRWLAELD